MGLRSVSSTRLSAGRRTAWRGAHARPRLLRRLRIALRALLGPRAWRGPRVGARRAAAAAAGVSTSRQRRRSRRWKRAARRACDAQWRAPAVLPDTACAPPSHPSLTLPDEQSRGHRRSGVARAGSCGDEGPVDAGNPFVRRLGRVKRRRPASPSHSSVQDGQA